MWGYEYEEQKRKQRKRSLFTLVATLIGAGILAWLVSTFFIIDSDDRKLFAAAESGEIAQAHIAIGAGADVDRKNWKGRTPLHVAAWHGHTDVARALLTAGADPNARDDSAGETPLHTAVRANDAEMVIVLMSGGARTSMRTFKESEPDVRGTVHPPGTTARGIAETSGFEQVSRILSGA